MEYNRDSSIDFYNLAKVCEARGDTERALKYARKSLRLYPDVGKVLGEDVEGFVEKLEGRTDDGEDTSSACQDDWSREQMEDVERIKKIDKKDFYKMLGVEKGCSAVEIKKAYKKMALKYHPDKNKAPGAEEAFKNITVAFAVLSNPEKRREYDVYGKVDGEERIFGQSGGPSGFDFGGEHVRDYNDLFRVLLSELSRQRFNDGNVHTRYYRKGGVYQRERPNPSLMAQILPLFILFMISFVGQMLSSILERR